MVETGRVCKLPWVKEALEARKGCRATRSVVVDMVTAPETATTERLGNKVTSEKTERRAKRALPG